MLLCRRRIAALRRSGTSQADRLRAATAVVGDIDRCLPRPGRGRLERHADRTARSRREFRRGHWAGRRPPKVAAVWSGRADATDGQPCGATVSQRYALSRAPDAYFLIAEVDARRAQLHYCADAGQRDRARRSRRAVWNASSAPFAPIATGLKMTLMEQSASAARLAGQLVVKSKELAPPPVSAMPVSASALVPALCTVTTLAALLGWSGRSQQAPYRQSDTLFRVYRAIAPGFQDTGNDEVPEWCDRDLISKWLRIIAVNCGIPEPD